MVGGRPPLEPSAATGVDVEPTILKAWSAGTGVTTATEVIISVVVGALGESVGAAAPRSSFVTTVTVVTSTAAPPPGSVGVDSEVVLDTICLLMFRGK